MSPIRVSVVVALLAASASPSLAKDIVPGPIFADVLRVYDGDTMTVDARPWPGQTNRVSVRVNGVDTPEIRGKCQGEKDQAVAARDFVRARVKGGVRLRNVHLGKYAGRVVADVEINGQNLADLLVAAGLARRYDGGKRAGWC